jgi:hypothetical protein
MIPFRSYQSKQQQQQQYLLLPLPHQQRFVLYTPDFCKSKSSRQQYHSPYYNISPYPTAFTPTYSYPTEQSTNLYPFLHRYTPISSLLSYSRHTLISPYHNLAPSHTTTIVTTRTVYYVNHPTQASTCTNTQKHTYSI